MPPEALVEDGRLLAQQLGCLGCHSTDGSTVIGPTWKGLFGKEETLQDGSTVIVDEQYIRRSIVDPSAQVVKGFPDNVMPKNYGDQLTEEQIQALIAYIKSLR